MNLPARRQRSQKQFAAPCRDAATQLISKRLFQTPLHTPNRTTEWPESFRCFRVFLHPYLDEFYLLIRNTDFFAYRGFELVMLLTAVFARFHKKMI